MKCPICKASRPEEPHLDWCTYDGPELPADEPDNDEPWEHLPEAEAGEEPRFVAFNLTFKVTLPISNRDETTLTMMQGADKIIGDGLKRIKAKVEHRFPTMKVEWNQ